MRISLLYQKQVLIKLNSCSEFSVCTAVDVIYLLNMPRSCRPPKMIWFCYCLSGFVLYCFGFALPTRTPRAFARSFLRATSLSAAEIFEYVCECNTRFEMENTLHSHISKSGHFNGIFNKEVVKKCRRAVVQVTAPVVQKAVPAAIVKPKYICECKEQFTDNNALQKHISKSGHFGGKLTKEVVKKCKAAAVQVTAPVIQKAVPAAIVKPKAAAVQVKAPVVQKAVPAATVKPKAAAVQVKAPVVQKAVPAAIVKPKYVCECKEHFAEKHELQSHILESGHFGGKYSKKVAKRCKAAAGQVTAPVIQKAVPAAIVKPKAAVVQVTAPVIQKAAPAAIVKPKYVCECKEQFAGKHELQKHISKSGHFGGKYNKEVANKCKQAAVQVTAPVVQKANPVSFFQMVYICACNEEFPNDKALQSHISETGHYDEKLDREMANIWEQATVSLRASLAQEADLAANRPSSRDSASKSYFKNWSLWRAL
jgi:hypothetical protein